MLTELETKTLLEGIDWISVGGMIEDWELPNEDAARCFDLVLHAAKTWVPEDFAPGCTVGEIEELRVDEFFKGYADVTVVRSPEYMKIIDWKTTGSVDAAWKTEHEKGWQALWYGRLWYEESINAGVPLIIEFRGIERGTGRTRVVAVNYDDEKVDTTHEIMSTVLSLRGQKTLKADGAACYAYGKPCPYLKKRCDEEQLVTMSELEAFFEAPISPTSAKRIFTCPRKNFLYQLDKLRGVGDTEGEKFKTGVNEKAAFGNAFHSGIGEVYKQLGKEKNQ